MCVCVCVWGGGLRCTCSLTTYFRPNISHDKVALFSVCYLPMRHHYSYKEKHNRVHDKSLPFFNQFNVIFNVILNARVVIVVTLFWLNQIDSTSRRFNLDCFLLSSRQRSQEKKKRRKDIVTLYCTFVHGRHGIILLRYTCIQVSHKNKNKLEALHVAKLFDKKWKRIVHYWFDCNISFSFGRAGRAGRGLANYRGLVPLPPSPERCPCVEVTICVGWTGLCCNVTEIS